jgi:putative long chain acyl-CoA synthase
MRPEVAMLRRVTRVPGKAIALAENASEVVRFGGLRTASEPAPYAVMATERHYRLRRYFPHRPASGPALVLVAPLMMSAEIWDVATEVSAVRDLHAAGIDPWVVDFGRPDREEGGLERTLSDHVVAVSGAIDAVREARGRDVHLGGYSQGGMLCYQVAAYRRSEGLAGVISFGSPVDLRQMLPEGAPAEVLTRVAALLGIVAGRGAVPGWATREAFRMLDPVKAVRNQLSFLLQLHDRDALLPREGQRRFIEGEGWVAFPGPALAEFAQQFLAHNRMLEGGIVIGGRTLTLADVTNPLLAVIGDQDQVASARAIRPLAAAAPRADTWETHVNAGHLGLVVGSRAKAQGWPAVIDWVRWADGRQAEPRIARRIADALAHERAASAAGSAEPPRPSALKAGAKVAAAVAVTGARAAASAGGSAADLGREALEQLPRLARLQRVRPETRTSLALTLDEQCAKAPDEIQFLYGEQAVTRAAGKARIDAVVRSLIHSGVRPGDRVGVLIGARPSAVAVIAALNRLGAIAVMLRPGSEVAREAALGGAGVIVCDPERLAQARTAGVPIRMIGGGRAPRAVPDGVLDLEAVDPQQVELPAWYEPNRGLAKDVAFVVFTGEGEQTRVNRITNRRWLLSAYGTATAASLGRRDTVYCLTPPSHPSHLLVGLGGAIAGGARFAMATRFDPDTFWAEVRRYGATVVTYTWRMLSALVDAPPHPGEMHHPIRLFVGSGMPPALWERVLRRFDPARVVEFYTAPDAEAVVVNLGRRKPGSLGRPLPGATRVRIAAWEERSGRLRTGEDGMAISCSPGEVGMLLAETELPARTGLEASLIRAVFAPDDAWIVTGDLAHRDEDGDIWLVDRATEIIETPDGRRSPRAIRDALESIDAVDCAVAYPVERDGATLAVAAVTQRAGHKALSSAALTAAFAHAGDEAAPDVVRVVEEIPLSEWFRPQPAHLRSAGIPAATADRPVWQLNRRTGRFRLAGRAGKAEAALAG